MGPPLEDNETFDADKLPDEPALEDEASLGDVSSRELIADEEYAPALVGVPADSVEIPLSADSDVEVEEDFRAISSEEKLGGDSVRGLSPGAIMAELQRVEDEVRQLLERMDPRRKRRFGGTRRWYELQEDLIQWRFGDRFDEPTLQRIQQLVAQRHHLYRQIGFLAGTRPTWNS